MLERIMCVFVRVQEVRAFKFAQWGKRDAHAPACACVRACRASVCVCTHNACGACVVSETGGLSECVSTCVRRRHLLNARTHNRGATHTMNAVE